MSRSTVSTTVVLTSLLGASSTSLGQVVLMDQIGADDGSSIDSSNVAASQIFEAAYSIYDIAAIDDFNANTAQHVTSVSMVLGGWNGYVGLDGIQGLSANLYLSPEEAAVSLIGYANADVMGTPAGDPNWTGPHELVHVDVVLFCNPGTAYVALIPINEFGTNGQTGCGASTLGDGNAWQANPGNGFGFGGLQSISNNLAYRVMGSYPDCNDNGIPDEDEIAEDPSLDCNGNGWLDTCEIAAGYDCNANGIVDECDIADGTSQDCNANGVPDVCDLADPVLNCNDNDWVDACEIADGLADDCNGNGVPDECDAITDCNDNGIEDSCDITDGTSQDCNGNGVPDECDAITDCNDNGIEDSCDIEDGSSQDCNNNLVPDSCDIADGTSQDLDGDGVPDECPLACESYILHEDIEAPSPEHEGFGFMMDAAGGLLAVRSEFGGFEQVTLYDTTTWSLVQDLALPWYKSGITPVLGRTTVFGDGFIAASGTWDSDRVAIWEPVGGAWQHTGVIEAPAGASEDFGYGIAASSDRIAVVDFYGNSANGGHVYIYQRAADASWDLYQTIVPPNGDVEYGWGIALAMDDQWLAVGSPEAGYGEVELYLNDGEGYLYHSTIASQGPPPWSSLGQFGWGEHLAIENGALVVGAGDGYWSGPGWIEIHRLDDDQWVHEATPEPTGLELDEIFGAAVHISGERICVGAPSGFYSTTDSGAVYVFDRDKNGLWQQQAKVETPSGEYAGFGLSCVVAGADVIAGAPYGSTDHVYVAAINTSLDPVDCNGNGVCDGLDLAVGLAADCNGNGLLDACEIADGGLADIDGNGVPDVCESDCDGDGWPDAAEILNGWASDCNGNTIPDACDIAAGTSPDVNKDGVPDECTSGYLIVVAQDGTGQFHEIQPAIDLAVSGIGTVVEVAPGSYDGGLNFQGKSIILRALTSPENTSIVGGARSISFIQGETPDAVLEGFMITGGGGVLCMGSNPTIRNCVIQDNMAYTGAGICCLGGGPMVVECEILDNVAMVSGGGIASLNSSLVLDECTIRANTSGGIGGGISATGGEPVVEGCAIMNNAANSGGGIYSISELTVTDTILCGNTPDQLNGQWADGGGTCLAFSCNDSDGNGIPDKCQGSTGDGIHEVPSEYATIQDAIAAAGNGDTVLVGPGTWTGAGDDGWVINPGGKQLTIQSTAGPESTVLDGEGMWQILVCTAGESAETVIEGFTMTNGYATSSGGAIYCRYSSPTVRNCIIRQNESAGDGGGVYCFYGQPTLIECQLLENSAQNYGGGIYALSSDVQVLGTTIHHNTAGSAGGGIRATNGSATFEDCDVYDNTSNSYGGGFSLYGSGSPRVLRCQIANNSGNGGDGLDCWGGSRPVIRGSEISGHQQGIWCYEPPVIVDTLFCENDLDVNGPWDDHGFNLFWLDCGDCNGNGIPDVQEILDGMLTDIDADGRPDQCEFDCDSDGVTDPLEIYYGTQTDSDADGLPDECEPDCDGDGIPDHYAIELGFVPDCNDNLFPDSCDIADGTVTDCDESGVPDVCEILDDPDLDCDGGGVLDVCDLADPMLNCNDNDWVDACEIADGLADDLNGDGIPDECQCLGDLNRDFFVGVDDLLLVLSQFGLSGGSADIDYDGIVGVSDILAMLSVWGPCP